jgi:hypothetical protein
VSLHGHGDDLDLAHLLIGIELAIGFSITTATSTPPGAMTQP